MKSQDVVQLTIRAAQVIKCASALIGAHDKRTAKLMLLQVLQQIRELTDWLNAVDEQP